MTLSNQLILEKNKIHSENPWIILLEITLLNGTVIRLARNTEDIAFKGTKDHGCMGLWKMNENAANAIILDYSGQDNRGTIEDPGGVPGATTAAHHATGVLGGGFTFDGAADADDRVNIPADATLALNSLTDGFSYMGWANLAGEGEDSTSYLLYKPSGAIIGYNSNREFYIMKWASTTYSSIYTGCPVFEWNVPFHIAVVFDIPSLRWKVWINGKPITSPRLYTEGVGSLNNDASQPLYFGNNNSSGATIDGELECWKFFNRKVSEKEVIFDYAKGDGTYQIPTLFTAFPFEMESSNASSSGLIPTTTLRVCNITRYLQPYLNDQGGGIGADVSLRIINAAYPHEDYSDLSWNFRALATVSKNNWVDFTIGTPNPLNKRFPLDRYFALSCRYRYRLADITINPECGYTPKTITGASNANPCVITATAHGFADGDSIYIEGIVDGGSTGSLETVLNDIAHTITYINANSFSVPVNTTVLDGYSSGGTAGYETCARNREDCAEHENITRYGGFLGLQGGGIKFV